jgi:uncharacterized protein (DUF302 family)
MKLFGGFLTGFVAAIALMGVLMFTVGPSMMIHEHLSPYGLDETVEMIVKNAKAEGWVSSGVKPLEKSIAKHGGGKVLPVRLIDLCEPHHAEKILNSDAERYVSVMMPCTISVYERADGKIYVSHMNAGLVGRMFGGKIAEVMAGPVTEQQNRFINFTN